MALKNPLAYYTPGIPGRGAGTILKQPDLTGYAARQMKLTDLKLKQKQDEDALKAKKLSDIITVDGDIWLNDQKYFDDRISEFQKEAISVWSKSNGNPDAVSLAKLKQKQSAIESEMKESKFHEQQRKEAIAKIEAFAATGKYDEQDVNDAFTKWGEWSKLTPSERAKQSPANTLSQPFDYNKFKRDVQNGGMLAKTQVGTMGGMININGRDVQVTQKYDIYPTKAAAEDLWLAYANGRTKEKTGIEQRYETWKQYNPNQTATYTEYVVNPSMKNIDVIQHKDVPVTNLKEWIEKVEAPSIAKYGQQQGFVSSGGGVNVSVGDKSKSIDGSANLQRDYFNVNYKNAAGESNTMTLPFDVYPLAKWSTNAKTSKLVPVQNNLIPNDAQRFNVVDNEKTGGQDIVIENPKGGAAYNVTIGRSGVMDVLGKKVNAITIIASTGDKINTSGEIEQRGITTEWKLDPIKHKQYIIDTFGEDAYNDAISVFKTIKTQQGSSQNNNTGGSKFKGLPKNGKF